MNCMKTLHRIATILLLSFSVIVVHGMVPHHHDTGITEGIHGCCHGSNDGQDDHGKVPQHCHAFNGLSFFKPGNISAVLHNIPAISPALYGPVKRQVTPPQEFTTVKDIFSETVNKGDFLLAFSFRGPPAVN